MSARVWVPGRTGILGAALLRHLADRAGVVVLGTTRADVDVTDAAQVQRFVGSERPTHVINATGYTAVDKAESERDAAFALNAHAPRVLAAAASVGAVAAHVSTDYVFGGDVPPDGGSEESAVRVDAPTGPRSVYGASKRAGEEAFLAAAGGRGVVVRTSWLYGQTGKHFPGTMLQLMKDRPALRVVADQRGRPTYAPDLAGALVGLVGLDDTPAVSGVVHAAGGGFCSWHALACAVRDGALARGAALACTEVAAITTTEYPTPAARPAWSVLDLGPAQRALGRPARPWRDALDAWLDHAVGPRHPAAS